MLKIVRNDIVKMNCDAIVNTANSAPIYSSGVDCAIYETAGAEELLAERQKIGYVEEGEVFVTDAYKLPVKKIIHAVSPIYIDGNSGEEDRLRSCYRKSLELANALSLNSIAFPVISTGSFGYPLEEGMAIAIEEINSFLVDNDMLVYLVVFGENATRIGKSYSADLESFIEQRYVEAKEATEYGEFGRRNSVYSNMCPVNAMPRMAECDKARPVEEFCEKDCIVNNFDNEISDDESDDFDIAEISAVKAEPSFVFDPDNDESFYELEKRLNNKISHLKDTFSEYLMYLIESRGMTPLEVYTRAIVNKKVFSKIKNNRDYHPSKTIAFQLCMGARLNIDDTKDLLARAGYTFSPCELVDVIFEFFIENEIYDMVELDVQMEEHGLPCFIKEE